MIALQSTYYIRNITAVIFIAVLISGCAGRGPRETPDYTRRPGARLEPAPGMPRITPPAIRVGLKTESTSAIFSSTGLIYFNDGRHSGGAPERILAGLSHVPQITTRYLVQVESFSTKENANAAADRLKSKTPYPVFVFYNPDRSMHQVRTGSFSSKEKAQQAVEELKKMGYSGAFTVSEISSSNGSPLLVLSDRTGALILKTNRAVQFWTSSGQVNVDGDPYRGLISVFVNRNGRLTIVNQLNLEEYLKGVIPNEIGAGSATTIEALKAQAVAARTYAYKNLKQFDADGYDICATPRCQVYSGYKTESNLTSDAVDQTKGEVMTYAGEAINALYTSTCGGRTENAEYMFDGWNYPYLKSVSCYPEESGERQKAVELHGRVQPWWMSWLSLKTGRSYPADLSRPASALEIQEATNDILQYLGKTACSQSAPVNSHWVGTGEYLVGQLCWQAKRDSLLDEKDYQYFLNHLNFNVAPAPETHSFLFLFHDGILLPQESDLQQFNPYQQISRRDLYQALFRILEHYHQINSTKGMIREISASEIQIVGDSGVHLYPLGDPLYLYQTMSDSQMARESVVCAPGDNVEYALNEDRLHILACELNRSGATVDRSSKYTFWQETFTPSELGEKVGKYADLGDIIDVEPLTYGVSRRIFEARITGTKGSAVFKGLRVRWALGLRDNLFTVDRTYGKNGKIRQFVFTGRGWGHGVGMCQVGAIGYSKHGKTYKEILKHYYTGVEISRMY
jgi:stage II sporulation protein D